MQNKANKSSKKAKSLMANAVAKRSPKEPHSALAVAVAVAVAVAAARAVLKRKAVAVAKRVLAKRVVLRVRVQVKIIALQSIGLKLT